MFDTADKASEQLRRAFKIEAVGLMSLWFSFGSGVLARFVVEWESGKEGCTMHVSPDQLWPHTKVCIYVTIFLYVHDCIILVFGYFSALAYWDSGFLHSPFCFGSHIPQFLKYSLICYIFFFLSLWY